LFRLTIVSPNEIAEGDGRDMCCIVASLVQVLLDPHWRSLRGFQTLIQKEWVVLGHPFCTRLAHVFTAESEQVNCGTTYLFCSIEDLTCCQIMS